MILTNDSAVSLCLLYQRLRIDLKCHKCHFTLVQMTDKIRDSQRNIFCRLIDETEIVQHQSNTVQIADRLLSPASRTILKGWVPVCSFKLHSRPIHTSRQFVLYVHSFKLFFAFDYDFLLFLLIHHVLMTVCLNLDYDYDFY